MNPARAKDTAKRAKADAYRKLIMDAAERTFAEHGFEAAKIQDIAQGAGLALGTLYSVFPGKSEIYLAIRALHGGEVLGEIVKAVQGYPDPLEATRRGIEAYVRCLLARPHYLRLLLREGLSWTHRSWLRSGAEVATWEQGMQLAVSLLQRGIESGLLYGDDPPEVLLKMIIAAQQVQLSDFIERGAAAGSVDALISRMQHHFERAYVRGAAHPKSEPFVATRLRSPKAAAR